MATKRHSMKGKSGKFIKSGKPVKAHKLPAFLKKKLGR